MKDLSNPTNKYDCPTCGLKDHRFRAHPCNPTNKELDNLIEMLEEDLEWLRNHPSPMNATAHKHNRIFLTLATEIKQLKSTPTSINKSGDE